MSDQTQLTGVKATQITGVKAKSKVCSALKIVAVVGGAVVVVAVDTALASTLSC